VEFLSNLNVKTPLHERKAPPNKESLLLTNLWRRFWCGPVVFAHLQCGLELRNGDGANLGSCWCRQRAKRFGQRERELSLPYAWNAPLNVALLGLSFLFGLADFAYM